MNKSNLIHKRFVQLCLIGSVSILSGCASLIFAQDKPPAEILKQVDVAPVWSVHRNAPPELLTTDGRQYVAYYDQDRFLTIAQRELGSDQWKFHRFPVQMGWETGAHAKLSLALDRDGYIHITCYRRSMLQAPPSPPAALYYRSAAPHSIDEFEHRYMISEAEYPHYPTFYTVGETLFFSYRDGSSGRGNQLLNRYDDARRVWVREFETPLLDGRGERSAYIHGSGGPMPGPDGRFHLLWVWRETPDHASNHSLSYARTVGDDLSQWESAAGVPVAPPFTIDNRELLVDDTPPGEGISNSLFRMNWDSKQRVVVSFHKFDENGVSQIYNARLINGEWRAVAATRWDFVWGDTYRGYGALGISDYLRINSIHPSGNGELTQDLWNRDDGGKLIVIDEESLSPIRAEDPRPTPEWRRVIMEPESTFQIKPIPELRRVGGPMQVHIIPDLDGADLEEVDYYLRWEHGGTNRDRPVPEPWPAPTMLRVYKIGSEN